ncbi:MAG TPA: PLP-dependent aspartate aminotransferase family protein [Candidatus Thermoplasmatota archaeon]|nr:PLP-dependent aspartate aminotransferase family protein [Candidatus Thermoplasmatota archaeon]
MAKARPAHHGPSTTAVHAGEGADPKTGAVNTPIHLSSTFRYPELADGSPSTHIYSRYTNPSVEAVEAKLAALEGAAGSLLFSSGMGATMTACMGLLRPGATLAVQQGVYGGTASYFRDHLTRWGVKVHPLGAVECGRIPKGTRLVWMEAVTNPLLRVADVGAWADAAHDAGALLTVDATFASPVLQRPLARGADLAMHSGTKYLGGHADLIAGALSWPTGSKLRDTLWKVRREWGPALDPHAAYLLGRGMKTLPVRMERQSRNSLALAKACQGMRGVRAVHHPGLSSHPDHKVAKRMLSGGFGGMLTLDLGSLERAKAFRRRVRLVTPAASLGGVESLVSLPRETSHAYASAAERRAEGITDGLVRISVGIEDAEDLLADIAQAVRS